MHALPLCFLALSLCALAPAAQGGDTDPTGLDLLERCHALTQEADPADAGRARLSGYCTGYLVGFVSGFAARDVAGTAGRFCPPADARLIDFADALQTWLVANPVGLDGSGAVVTLRALLSKFPCPDGVRDAPGGTTQ
jgi:hypothetical protein